MFLIPQIRHSWKYGVIGGIACASVYVYIYSDILLQNYRQRTHSPIPLQSESIDDKITGERNSTRNTSSKTLFEVFELMNLTMLQKMETDRDEFNFLLTPIKLTWKVLSSFQHKTIKWSMVVAIKSDYKRIDQRNIVRNTWGGIQLLDGVRVEVIFVTGRPESQPQQINLWKENIQFGDILEVDQNETYHGIGLKALASMQWVAENMPDEWMYFSADDDIYPDMAVLLEDAERLIESATGNVTDVPIICAYSYEPVNIPERGDTKWKISRDIYPYDLYPPFCLGGFYGMPIKLASAIYDVSRHYPYYRMDDVFITGFMRLKFCDVYTAGTFAYDKSDKNCAISTKRNSNFKHLSLQHLRYQRLWKQQESALVRKGIDIMKRRSRSISPRR